MKINSSRCRVQNHQIQSRHTHRGVHHFHWRLSYDGWVVLCRPSGSYLVARWLPLSHLILNTMVSWRSIWCKSFLRCVCWDPMNFEFMISYIFLYPWKLFEFFDLLYAWSLIASYFFSDIWVLLIYLSCNGKRCPVVGSILRCLIPVTKREPTCMYRCY